MWFFCSKVINNQEKYRKKVTEFEHGGKMLLYNKIEGIVILNFM